MDLNSLFLYVTPNGETAVEMCHIEHVGWYTVTAFIMIRSKPRERAIALVRIDLMSHRGK